MKSYLEAVDRGLSIASEEAARRMSRRHVLLRSLKGVAGATAALSVGSLIKPGLARAEVCDCQWIRHCEAAYPPNTYYCPGNSDPCPAGCEICIKTDCDECPYPSGWWLSCHCGPCGGGYRLCYDCRCQSCGSETCTCLTGCICSGCCSPQEVLADMVARGLIPAQAPA